MKTIEEFNQYIEESNAAFKKANKKRKIVLLAKDVIERIKLKQLKATAGVTCRLEDKRGVKAEDSIKEILPKIKNCECCAKGALFLGYIGRVNEMTVGEIEDETSHNSSEMKKLLKIFDENQLSLIETAFEGHQVVNIDSKKEWIEIKEDVLDKAVQYFYDYPSSTKRLVAICENLIKNQGTFIP